MPEPRFRLVCPPSALAGTPPGWAHDMLREGEVALLTGEGLAAIDAIAHALGQPAIVVVRSEPSDAEQDRTVIGFAAALPLIWVAPAFSDTATRWAHDRGPMTLLAECAGTLSDQERQRINRFVAILGRQSE